jgi:PA14 domain/Bacterial SH3 domain
MKRPMDRLTQSLIFVVLLILVFAGAALAQEQQTAWQAQYWNNPTWSGSPYFERIEFETPDVGWGQGSPAPGIQSDDFSARWTANQFFEPGRYRFALRTDDGARLWVDNQLVLDIDTTGEEFTADVDITRSGNVPIRLDYYEEKGNAGVHLSWTYVGNAATTGPIRAEYYNNQEFQGAPVLVRNEGPGLYHNWGNSSPAPGIVNDDHFSARYSQSLYLQQPGWYRFTTRSDDGLRLWIDGQVVIDEWHDSDGTTTNEDVYLPAGTHNFLVQYYENVGNASLGLVATYLGAGSSGGSGGGFGGGTDGSSSSGGAGGGFGGGTDGSSSSGGSGGGFGGGTELPPANTTATVNTGALNMRSGPGTQYEPIRTLNFGEVVTFTGLYENGWAHVHTADNFAGWVNPSYLSY